MSVANALTGLRLVLAFVLFGLLASVNVSFLRHPEQFSFLMATSILSLFVVTLLTDLLDGYVARNWDTESWVGRMADPLVDKVFICGLLIMLLGFPRQRVQSVLHEWMVMLVVSRELLIQGVRSGMEKHGIDFPAMIWGKLKMVVQSLTVFVLLVYGLVNLEALWLDRAASVLIWLMVLVTLISAIMYFWQAFQKINQFDFDSDPA